MSIFDLTGRVAVITGGNGGIGLGIAQALERRWLQRLDLGPQRREEQGAAATMAAGTGKVDTRICDVSDPASVKAAMKATLEPSAGSTAVSPMPASAAADGAPSSTAPRRNGEGCSRPISTACSTCSRPPPAT